MSTSLNSIFPALCEVITDSLLHLKDACFTHRTPAEIALACVAAVTFRYVVWIPLRLYLLPKCLPSAVRVTDLGRWAVITGATDGIGFTAISSPWQVISCNTVAIVKPHQPSPDFVAGKEYAVKLAGLGLDIVLISRSAEKLAHVQSDIQLKSQREVRTIQVDFKSADIYDTIRAGLEGLDIAVLVNNVGMTTPEFAPFLENKSLELSHDLLTVNCLSMTNMCSLVLPHMVEKRKGIIVNISSCLAEYGSTHSTIYAATKSYNLMLSNCLRRGYQNTGVIIQTLTPGLIRTKLLPSFVYKKSTKVKSMMLPLFSTTPEEFVSSAINTIGRSDLCHGHISYYYQDLVVALTPTSIFDKISANN